MNPNPMKECPQCRAGLGVWARSCSSCGFQFPRGTRIAKIPPLRVVPPPVETAAFQVTPTPSGGAVLHWPRLQQRVTLDPKEWAIVRAAVALS